MATSRRALCRRRQANHWLLSMACIMAWTSSDITCADPRDEGGSRGEGATGGWEGREEGETIGRAGKRRKDGRRGERRGVRILGR